MERLHILVDLEDPDADHYMCKACKIPVALRKDITLLFSEQNTMSDNIVSGYAVFEKAVNVFEDESKGHRQVGNNTVADVFCAKCGDGLGWKYIEVHGPQVKVKKNYVRLDTAKLLLKKGNELLDGLTDDPVTLPANPVLPVPADPQPSTGPENP